MGEKLELRLESPVGAEPAVYPWPLPVYVPRSCRDGLPAHVGSLAQRAYWALLSQQRDQSIVALGRSGAGKTTCCEQVLEHLVGMAGSVDGRVSGTVVSSGEDSSHLHCPPGLWLRVHRPQPPCHPVLHGDVTGLQRHRPSHGRPAPDDAVGEEPRGPAAGRRQFRGFLPDASQIGPGSQDRTVPAPAGRQQLLRHGRMA
ncbi:uncharacterized protein AAG666_000088 isoform 7-T10 [Megaptera novaeangliae]